MESFANHVVVLLALHSAIYFLTGTNVVQPIPWQAIFKMFIEAVFSVLVFTIGIMYVYRETIAVLVFLSTLTRLTPRVYRRIQSEGTRRLCCAVTFALIALTIALVFRRFPAHLACILVVFAIAKADELAKTNACIEYCARAKPTRLLQPTE